MSNFSTIQELLDFMSRNREQILKILYKNLEDYPTALYELSTHGWYFGHNFTMGHIIHLWKLLKSGKTERMQNEISDIIENDLEKIENRLIILNKERSDIIKEAFNNHREKKYYSSIVLLLSQIDGMSQERFGMDLISTKNNQVRLERNINNNKEIKDFFNKDLNLFPKGYRVLFSKATSINDSYQNENNYPVFLNRHKILHGIDLTFGNRINSLRIISYINFVNDLVCFNLSELKPRKKL